MNSNNKPSSSQLRLCRVLDQLFGYELDGIACQEIANRMGLNKTIVWRDLVALQAAGYAEQLPSKNWRVSAKLGRCAIKIMTNMDRAASRLEETKTRYLHN